MQSTGIAGSEMKLKQGITLIKEIFKALFETNMAFPEMFDDYELYHQKVNTGNLERAKLIAGWFERGSTVLDVGVGDGLVLEYLKNERGVEVWGLDVSTVACQKAKDKGIPTIVRDINSGLGLREDEYFDYLLLSEVIEHTVQPQRILADAVRHARKGVIVTIPNTGFVKWRIYLLRGYFPRQSFTHLHFWSVRDFEIFCNLLGLNVIGFKTFLPNFLLPFRNLFAWQQCWLIAPKSKTIVANS